MIRDNHFTSDIAGPDALSMTGGQHTGKSINLSGIQKGTRFRLAGENGCFFRYLPMRFYMMHIE